MDNLLEGAGNTGEWDDGSQWDLEAEGGGSLHSHEDVPHVNKISILDITLEPEEDDMVYVWAVREKVVTLQKENPA